MVNSLWLRRGFLTCAIGEIEGLTKYRGSFDMKHRNRAKSSSLFLLELVLAILFFSLASAVCVQFFVKSHILSRDAQRLNHAVSECSGMAEIVNTSDGMTNAIEVITGLYPDASLTDSEENGDVPSVSALIFYDKEFIPCAEKDKAYVLQAVLWEQGQMLTAGMTIGEAETEDPIYELTVKHYLQRRADHAKR